MEEEDTIELIDLLRVLWKWKWFLIIFTLACSIVAGIISFSMPKIYEVSMVIEPGVVYVDSNGRPIYLDSPSNIKSKIESGAYDRKIIKRLLADPKKLKLKFKIVMPKNSNTLKIRVESRDINKNIQAFSILFDELVKEYQHYVDSRKSELDKEVAMNKGQLYNYAIEKKYLDKEIIQVKSNTNRIIEDRNMLIKKEGNSSDKLSLLIYTNIIQQNMKHYNDLNIQLSKLMTKIEKGKKEVETLKIKSESIENIKLIQPPQSSIYPIKPKKKFNVILAFVIGLMFSIFLAFFLEYFQKMKGYPKSIPTTDQRSSIENQEH